MFMNRTHILVELITGVQYYCIEIFSSLFYTYSQQHYSNVECLRLLLISTLPIISCINSHSLQIEFIKLFTKQLSIALVKFERIFHRWTFAFKIYSDRNLLRSDRKESFLRFSEFAFIKLLFLIESFIIEQSGVEFSIQHII